MTIAVASYPTWDGSTRNRIGRLDNKQPDAFDWDKLVAELLKHQEVVSILETQSPNLVVKLATVNNINAKVVGTTNLYTVPVDKRCVVTKVVTRCTNGNTVTGVPTLGVGIASGEIDIMPSTALTGLDTTDEIYNYNIAGISAVGNNNDVIKLGIDTGATATAMTISVDLLGYLF